MAARLRAFVRQRVHKDGERYSRGAASELGKALGKPPSWVSHYVDENPERNADVDTALAICAFYGVNLADFAKVTSPVMAADQRSGSRTGGPDGIPAPSERDRISELESELRELKARHRQVQNAARAAFKQLGKVAQYIGQSESASGAATKRSGAARRTS